jgi:hypothetical protein
MRARLRLPRSPSLRASALAALAGLAVAAPSVTARADDTTVALRAAAARESDRPHTIADANSGFLLLPGALVCPESLSTCKRGEFSFAVGLQNLYRFGPFGIGAGIQWATTLRSDAAGGDPSLQREHSRSYFLVEAQFRYYFLRSKAWEFWAGGTGGLVVVDDSWTTIANRDPTSQVELLGNYAETLGTEGLTLGAGASAEWTFLPNWSFGPSLLYSSWFLPTTRKISPTLDVASLAGRLDVIDVGIRIAYHIAL